MSEQPNPPDLLGPIDKIAEELLNNGVPSDIARSIVLSIGITIQMFVTDDRFATKAINEVIWKLINTPTFIPIIRPSQTLQ